MIVLKFFDMRFRYETYTRLLAFSVGFLRDWRDRRRSALLKFVTGVLMYDGRRVEGRQSKGAEKFNLDSSRRGCLREARAHPLLQRDRSLFFTLSRRGVRKKVHRALRGG